MKKRVLAVVLSLVTLFTTVPAMASPVNGWENLGGAPVYYQNGAMVTNCWVKYGNTFYFMDASGHITPNYVFNQDGLAYSGITAYIDTNTAQLVTGVVQAEPDDYKAVREICGVQDDFDAFKKRNPDIVRAYGADVKGLYAAYVASYNGMPVGHKYQELYLDYLKSIYNAHIYEHHYENMYNGTHKAYCECGAWQIQNCNRDIETAPGGPYLCNACHASYNYGE